MILEEIYNLGEQLNMDVGFSFLETSHDNGRCETYVNIGYDYGTPDLAIAKQKEKGFGYVSGIFAVLTDRNNREMIIPVDGYEYPFD